jgi:hypothetical protein
MNKNDDAFAMLAKIIVDDWGGDTVAFYKHVAGMKKAQSLRAALDESAKTLAFQQETEHLERYEALAKSHARLIEALESSLKFYKRMGYNREIERVEKALSSAKALASQP